MRKNIVCSSSSKGFTLIELMVVIMVVAILGVIAVPTYSAQVRKSRRVEARSALLDLAAREERFYATSNFYSILPSDVGYTGAWPIQVGSNYYQLSATCAAGRNPCTDYKLTATAIGTQQKDKECLGLTLDSTGVQDVAAGATGTAATCWN